jgi:hypothetical protein
MLVGRLRAADQRVLIVFCGQHDAAIGLQVEVLLATKADAALKHVVRSCREKTEKTEGVKDSEKDEVNRSYNIPAYRCVGRLCLMCHHSSSSSPSSLRCSVKRDTH